MHSTLSRMLVNMSRKYEVISQGLSIVGFEPRTSTSQILRSVGDGIGLIVMLVYCFRLYSIVDSL